MLPAVSRKTTTTVTAIVTALALAAAAPAPAYAWGKKEQNFLAGVAAAVAIGALIKHNRANAGPAPVYSYPTHPQPVHPQPRYGHRDRDDDRKGHRRDRDHRADHDRHLSSQVAATAFRDYSPAGRRAIQQQLRAMGYYRGPIDGAWGPGTWNAVQSYALAMRSTESLRSRDGTVLLLNRLIT